MAAHAANAGACATVLKAFFNEAFVLPKPVQTSVDCNALEPWTGADLTLGDEVNKLANNIALGRDAVGWDAVGVHYRSDSVRGLKAGEAQAIGLLADYSRTYHERFGGFVLRKGAVYHQLLRFRSRRNPLGIGEPSRCFLVSLAWGRCESNRTDW